MLAYWIEMIEERAPVKTASLIIFADDDHHSLWNCQFLLLTHCQVYRNLVVTFEAKDIERVLDLNKGVKRLLQDQRVTLAFNLDFFRL
jgi:hypothetical protein